MTFDEILEQVITLLKRQGRVSYGALRRRYNLDEDYLEDLKDEIIHAQRLAVDEDNRLLVWVGDAGATPEAALRLNQPEPVPIIETVQPLPVESSPTNLPDAERRQLTVMFVDLVDSTRLSSDLDPEIYREIVREYQRSCSEVITKYDGNVAQLLGDGLLVYFGYPQAHEDDAQRAVRSGLGIINAIGNLNSHLKQSKGIRLAIRLGVHTGLVVVGEIGGSGRQEQLALGETPNIAARIQGLAEPDTLIVSDATYRLIQGYFDCETLGERELRGVADPVVIYHVLSESSAQSRLDVASTRGLTPLVGRESESTLLFERWEQAKAGNGQVVLLSGEAGIGKSRLVQALKDHVADEPHTRMECRSSPYFSNSALYPITDFLQRMLRFQADDTLEQKLEKLTQKLSQYRLPLDESVPLFGTLLSLPVPKDQYPTLNLTPQRQRQMMLEAIVAIMLELSAQQPLLFILEDLHWTDPTTLEFMELLVDQTPTASLCVLLTCRPEFQPSWSHRSYLTEMTVSRLSPSQVEQVATQVAGGKTLPAHVIAQLIARTDGVPLYVEEMTKSVLESGVLKETDERYELTGSITSLSIPATLQDSLMARLDRLGTAKGIAQLGATIGRQFSYELLHAVSQLDETILKRELGRLVEAELIYQRGLPPHANYAFKHALVQDIAYESLLRSTRRGYHRRIAQVLEDQFPATTENQPELLAHYFTEAGLNEEAVDYWYKSGQKAIERSANAEAISHITNGLELIKTLADTSQRDLQELTLQRTIGVPLLATKGFAAPEVEAVYIRAQTLCQQVGDTSQIVPVLFGLWGVYHLRMEWRHARGLAEQLLTLGTSQQNPGHLLIAHRAMGDTLHYLGEFFSARTHLEQGMALYNFNQHGSYAYLYGQDPLVGCQAYAAHVLWLLGYPEQALRLTKAAIFSAQQCAHLFSLGLALRQSLVLYGYLREWQTALEQADILATFVREQGLTQWLSGATMAQGLALAMLGDREGIAQIRQGISTNRSLGGRTRPGYLIQLAEVFCMVDQEEEGLHLINEALSVAEETGERNCEAESHRLKGVLLLQQSPDNTSEAESCFQKAITIAQNQSAKSWELRAATSLARLWQGQGKRQEAYDLLAPVYEWFTEGFDTADLIDAKALLDELSEVSQS